MRFSMSGIAHQILDEIAILLMEIDHVNPQCVAQLNLDTDIKHCLNLSSLQFTLFKGYLKKMYCLPFDCLKTERVSFPMKELIAYIIMNSDDSMLEVWGETERVA